MKFTKKHALPVLLCSALFAVGSVYAHSALNWSTNDNNHITIKHLHDKDRARYTVNGKTFTWNDLTVEQQSKLAPIQEQLKMLESAFDYDTKALELATKNIEEKAKEIENEVRKIEQARLTIDTNTVSFEDIAKWSEALSKQTQINETLLAKKSREIAELEKSLPQISNEKIEQIERYAEQLERVITEIAATIN